MAAFAAGDAEEIAEASAAIFSGKIKGLEVARALGADVGEIKKEWYETAEILKSKPGRTEPETYPADESGVFPVLHCVQEIPCDPCTTVCKQDLIHIHSSDIRCLPVFEVKDGAKGCTGCEKCVTICPGLAISLVDYRKDPEFPTVTLPYEFLKDEHRGRRHRHRPRHRRQRPRRRRSRRRPGDQGQRPDRARQAQDAARRRQKGRRRSGSRTTRSRSPWPATSSARPTTRSSAAANA